MDLSPRLYHWLIRPEWYNKKYSKKILLKKFNFTNKKVLDFGCGIGSNSFLIKPENYLGIDPDKKRIRYARKMNPGYRFDVLNEELNLPENTFDIILIIAVLHHIPTEKMPGILCKIEKTLKKPNGKIIVIEPCIFPEHQLNNFIMKTLDRGKYIRKKSDYLNIFRHRDFKINFVKKMSKLLYKEIFFSVSLNI